MPYSHYSCAVSVAHIKDLDVLMPAIGIILGGVSFKDLKYVITPANGDVLESAILYGSFIQSIIDFLIIAFSIFLFVKLLNSRKKKEDAAPVAPSSEVVILEEIRDIIKSK